MICFNGAIPSVRNIILSQTRALFISEMNTYTYPQKKCLKIETHFREIDHFGGV